jgi:hypothetical protein
VALTASIPPMLNAFLLVCLVTAIYAIIAVTYAELELNLYAATKPQLYAAN